MTLFLPPLRTGKRGARRSTARDKATAARRTSVKVQRGSIRTLTCMPREPLVFGQPRRPNSSRSALHFERNPAHIIPANPRDRIEINPQFIRMFKIAGANWMRVQLDAAKVHDPGETSGIIDHDFFCSPAGRKGKVTVRNHAGRLSGARF